MYVCYRFFFTLLTLLTFPPLIFFRIKSPRSPKAYFLTDAKPTCFSGYHIREKSKQVMTLLVDEELLRREREAACRTRQRTSHSMTFPKRLPGTANTPAVCASAHTPEIPALERKRKLLKVARQRNTSTYNERWPRM